ncbi:MAG: FecR domain-containing protein, partial [Candidatus Eremiobacteraeota bacterium]|nr:FecR domain-containing protein [Candidatus Eremiobacteraeota bacterium]
RAADPIGQIKTAAGTVAIERAGARQPAAAGDRVLQSDVVTTGADGTVGITFLDNSMMSLGPSSSLALDQFRFDSTTHDGVFESSLKRGTLAVKSGYIVQQTPEAMRVRTPAAILGVRGTEFVVRAEGDR